jgi:enamine deaminase RidA (YjgF/YER057c/UK114 family)
MGLILPDVIQPSGSYAHAIRAGDLLFLAGKGVGSARGKVGLDVSLTEAQSFAKTTTLMLLAVIQQELGSIDHVARIVKVSGFVNATAEFTDHPRVMDACSALLESVFGQAGVHARTSIGVSSTPDQIPVEIEAIIEIKKQHSIGA